jgi:methionine biosynthesis protein MetW
VAREGIVSFPNFGNWANRLRLGLRGRMPKSSALPFEWYETPNIHHTTLRDFADLCAQDGMDVRQCLPLAEDRLSCALLHLGLGNLGADRVLVRIGRRRDG